MQVAGAPVVFTMSCSHRSLTFLLWHILITRHTPKRLKPLTHTLVWRSLYFLFVFLFVFCCFLFLMTSHRLFTHSLAWPQTTFLSYRRINLAHLFFFFLLRSTPYIRYIQSTSYIQSTYVDIVSNTNNGPTYSQPLGSHAVPSCWVGTLPTFGLIHRFHLHFKDQK